MAQYNITLKEEIVRELFLRTGEFDVFKMLMQEVINQLLFARAEDMCGAKPYEQTEERSDYRNGYRERKITTRIGVIEIAVPRLRGRSILDGGVFGAYKRSEQALIAGIAEMVVKGVSTRKIDDIAHVLLGTDISKSQVSRMCKMLDPIVEEFRLRPLDEYYPFVVVDAIYLKVRHTGKVVSKALYIATGVNTSGSREVLGITLADKETKEQYAEFFRDLKQRGLAKVDFVVSDNHSGLCAALKEEFLGATWQRCQTHFSRNMMDKTPKKHWEKTKEMLREIYTAKDTETARARKSEAIKFLKDNAPKAASLLDDAFDDITAVLSLPMPYRKKLRTSNSIERLNEEVRRRERSIRIFPNDSSVIRILGSVLLEQHEKWIGGKRYMDMNEYFECIDEKYASADEHSGEEVA